MGSTVTFTTFSNPKTLFNVGLEALCMLCDNILCFMDLKTSAVTYYKAESPETGLSIQAATGHNKLSLVAFCELVFRPSVHILEYPSLNKYAVFKTKNIITFVDIRFNDHDLLLALSGFPHYTFCIWNIRTGDQLLQHDTMKESLAQSILCSHLETPQIVQFSETHQEIVIWNLCYTSTGASFHEVSAIQLSKDFTFSNIFSLCYAEENNLLYAVDNFANLFLVEVSHFYLKPLWSTRDAQEVCATLRRFRLENHKQGLLVYSPEIVYYLHRKHNRWQCEWKLLANQLPQSLCKCLSAGNGEIYASAAVGNLYQIKLAAENIEVHPVSAHPNENCLDVTQLRGSREECLMQLTTTHFVKAVAMSHSMLYSRIEIPQATCIAAHNAAPYILVGTSNGEIYFLKYKNLTEPAIVASLQNEKSFSIESLLFFGSLAVYRTIYNEFRLLVADIRNNALYQVVTFERFTSEVGIAECVLAENHIFIFFNRDSDILVPHANLMSCYHYHAEKKIYNRLEFNLPCTYRAVGAMLTPATKNVVEFYAVRLETCIVDYLNFQTDTNEFVKLYSIRTNHLSHIHGIKSSMNLLTWGSDGTFVHYRLHRKSPHPYGVSQILQIKYRPRVVKKVLECYTAKYLVYLYARGGIKVMRVCPTAAEPIENSFINEPPLNIGPNSVTVHAVDVRKSTHSIEYTAEELKARDKILENVQSLRERVSNLIDYDMSVTGKSQGVFKKFCLNHRWLNELTEEARKLCQGELKSLEAAIMDQSRIRDWIYNFVTSTNMGIAYQLRAIFSHFSVTNFGLGKATYFSELFDLYRFYEMDAVANEAADEDEESEGDVQEGQKDMQTKERIYYVKAGVSAYDHVMCDKFAMQDVNIVTGNQMINQDIKMRFLLIERLNNDFNKKFEEIKQIKQELMEAIWSTNSELNKIYDNMNCMLRLLGRSQMKPPQLAVPEWHKDEFVKQIMEVDDSEIKAVNRRKMKVEIEVEKRGRLLLWSLEFWQRALNTMMDGVLEKLWEEEIKKEIPEPEFFSKKDIAEYTLEDQKAVKEYEEKCRLLVLDRQKYLKILIDNESKTNSRKTSYILMLNESVTQLMITKLKYDFVITHVRLRNFNTTIMYLKKLQWLERISMLRSDIDVFTEYIEKYSKLHELWSKSVDDFRQKVESLTLKQRAVERQFKGQFLNSIPQYMGPEMNKTFKKKPKIAPKLLNSNLICKELAMRINSKAKPKFPFPLPNDIFEYLEGLNALDDIANMPVSLEAKNWEQFVKLRRQKLEMELKIRAVNNQLADFVSEMNYYGKELGSLKNAKIDDTNKLLEAREEYLKSIQDQTLELRLTMGQVEYNILGSLKKLENGVLIHKDDINDINALILKAGQQKLKAMQKVALFRRQVTFKEWEHKVVSANTAYLKNILYVIEKCKVSLEFLHILRNWEKVKLKKQELINTEGILEKVAEQKLAGYRREIIRMNDKILHVRQQIDEMKQANKRINRQIDELNTSVALSRTNRDDLIEEKRKREQNEKMEKIKKHCNLIEVVRRDYVHIMELKTILELQRLRTYPTLGPNPNLCPN